MEDRESARSQPNLDMTQISEDMPPFEELSCSMCQEGAGLDFEFTMAFQPIVDFATMTLHGYEALVRGPAGEGADAILARVNARNRYRFDQACRVRAIELAARLGLDSALHINFLPNAVYRPESCIRTTMEAARVFGFPPDRICLEVVESEKVEDHGHMRRIIEEYRRCGLMTAIDDFGAGYAGLNMLAEFQPDILKMDMALTRAIDADRTRQVILRSILSAAKDLGIAVVAEGIETEAELDTLREAGVTLFQGYLLGRPALERIEPVDLSRWS